MPFVTSQLAKYVWTHHAHDKMRYYRLSESRIKRIIRYPTRTEEGVLEDGVACMQPAGSKTYSEIWVMYILSGTSMARQIKIITCWRYPSKSTSRDPIPADILKEIQMLL